MSAVGRRSVHLLKYSTSTHRMFPRARDEPGCFKRSLYLPLAICLHSHWGLAHGLILTCCCRKHSRMCNYNFKIFFPPWLVASCNCIHWIRSVSAGVGNQRLQSRVRLFKDFFFTLVACIVVLEIIRSFFPEYEKKCPLLFCLSTPEVAF